MESGQVAAEPNLSTCCISHEFLKAASKSPEKIAVIHASGFARLASDRRRNGTSYQPPVHYTKPSSHPLVYDGYECFTFSDILSAVESTSLRLSRILHGADDDPHLIRPSLGSKGMNASPQSVITDRTATMYSTDGSIYIATTFGVCIVSNLVLTPKLEHCKGPEKCPDFSLEP